MKEVIYLVILPREV